MITAQGMIVIKTKEKTWLADFVEENVQNVFVIKSKTIPGLFIATTVREKSLSQLIPVAISLLKYNKDNIFSKCTGYIIIYNKTK